MKLNENIWKLLGTLALIVLVSTFLIRSLNSSQTLYDYAQENPELAYLETTSEAETTTKSQPETISETIEELSDSSTSENTVSTSRYTLCEGFFYEAIPESIKKQMIGVSYPTEEQEHISFDDLVYLNVLYYNFDNEIVTGELICNQQIALDLLEIFEELYYNNYQINEIALIDKYKGDDTLSMENNNTSCFNYRVVDGADHLSKHATGMAIDINPFYNPYVVYDKDGSGKTYISPIGSEPYADRTKSFPYKIDENDLCYKLFIEHGFTWGGNWNSSKDYQHFQK